MAGVACAAVSHPAGSCFDLLQIRILLTIELDVMVSKLNSDRKAGEGAMAAMSRIYGKIGTRGLFNGLGVRIIMIGTLTGSQFLIYDSFKVFLGVSMLQPRC